MKYIVSGSILIDLTENRVTVLSLQFLYVRGERVDVKFTQVRSSPDHQLQASSASFVEGKELVYKRKKIDF